MSAALPEAVRRVQFELQSRVFSRRIMIDPFRFVRSYAPLPPYVSSPKVILMSFPSVNRRHFLAQSSLALGATALATSSLGKLAGAAEKLPFKISLAQWSLHKNIVR